MLSPIKMENDLYNISFRRVRVFVTAGFTVLLAVF